MTFLACGGRALVLGDYRQTVTVVRSLGRAGYRVTLGTHDPRSPSTRSRYVEHVWVYDGGSAQRFRQDVEAFLREVQPALVFVVGESQLRRLLDVAPAMEALATWANPEFATVARCFDKRAMYELAPGLGVPCVPWSAWSGVEDWRRRASEMGYPVVVKRKDSADQLQERKALVYDSKPQFEAFLASLRPEHEPAALVLQKYATGVRHNCHIGAADGRLIAYFQQKVLRTDEADDTGIGVAGVSVAPSPHLRACCERLTRALGYTGIGCIQFMVDERTGAAAFLEFNARMDSTAALPYRMGLDFPLLAAKLAVYRKARALGRADAERLLPAPLASDYRAGVTYHWLQGDLGACVREVRARRVSAGALVRRLASMAWLAARSHHLTFEWRDPLPTAYMFWRKYAGKRLLRRLLPARRLAK